jgi:uncharacterized protein YkwD
VLPRNLREAAYFLFGLWAAFALLVPLVAPSHARAAEPYLERVEHEIFEAVNRFRSERNLIVLVRRADLDAVARAHSQDMVARHFFAHENPEGQIWVDRLRIAGVEGFSLAGENVGLTSRSEPVREIVGGWERSPVHLENLKARPFNASGVGIARAADGTLYVTQLYLTFPKD